MDKLLKLSDVRFKLPFNINHGLSVFVIRDLLKYPDEYIVDFDVYLPTKGKNLQRPFVWTLFQKQELIMSMLKEIKLTPMAIIQYKDEDKNDDVRIYKVIDGKQRLSTILSFARGEFPIEVKGISYTINDFDDWARNAILNHWVLADVGYEYTSTPISDDNKIKWFELINFAGTPQDIEHLNNLKS